MNHQPDSDSDSEQSLDSSGDPAAPGYSRGSVLKRGLLAAGAVSVGAAGLGSSAAAAPSAAPLADVRRNIALSKAVPKFKPPGPAFDATPARGKTVFYLSITFGVSIVQVLYAGVQEAAKAVGVKTLSFDAKGQPNLYLAGMQQAISRKVDLILVESIENTLINQQIKQAHAAGIPVVLINEKYRGGPNIEPVDAKVAFDYVGGAILEADYILADSGGRNINCVIFQAPSRRHDDMTRAIKARFAKYARGSYKVRVEKVGFADFATRLPTLTRTLMTRDPDINYMVTVIDGMALYVIPGLKQAKADKKVKLTTYNGTPSVLEFLKRKDVVIADTGGANTWEGWTDMDQALRVLTETKVVPGESKPPNRAFDRTNINSIDLNQKEEIWYNTAAAKQGFKKLWGVG